MNRSTCCLFLILVTAGSAEAQGRPRVTMPSFHSDSAMIAYIRRLMAIAPARAHGMGSGGAMADAVGASAQAPMARRDAGDAITNVQMQGVDEGDIVKLHGDYLVILRRGRLFTVAVGGNALRPASTSDAFGEGIDPSSTWYDEMLISDDRVVVIGYSYERGGTEVGVFRLANDGSLRYEQTFQLRSNDYYSSRNYATRLVGSKLVYYAPLYLGWGTSNVSEMLPALQRWSRHAGNRGFHVITTPERVYHPVGWQSGGDVTLHTVTSCDLATPEVQCDATVVIGPPGNVFYVSQGAVYVWMSAWYSQPDQRVPSMLARIPLDGSAPSAERVSGSPVDQFSFLETDGYLNVLTLSGSAGDGMWGAERAGGNASMLRIAIDSLGDGSRAAPAWFYQPLPPPAQGTVQNRFAGNYLLYGTGSGWGSEEQASRVLYAVPFRGGEISTLHLPHGTDRIEVMGNGAVVVGVKGNDLEFSGLSLEGRPHLVQRYTMAGASQGEMRSHGFFYRPDADGDAGILGLPVREAARPGWTHLVDGSASILFLRNSDGRFSELGKLEAGEVRNEDNCRASCVDWYGNARPIFARGRIFALLGYELVEGRISDGVMRESRRVNFLPRAMTAMR